MAQPGCSCHLPKGSVRHCPLEPPSKQLCVHDEPWAGKPRVRPHATHDVCGWGAKFLLPHPLTVSGSPDCGWPYLKYGL